MANDLAARLRDLARRVERLSPSHRDPERFHDEKGSISEELQHEADELTRWPLA